MEGNVLWAIGGSLLIQAVFYGKLIQKVESISNTLIGKDGNNGIVSKVQELETDVEVIKATHLAAKANGGM